MNSKIRGLNAIVLKRCSGAAQIATSITNQGTTTDDCVKTHNIRVVHEEALEGVTGSVPGNRTDIDRIIARKKSKNDFDLLLVQDTTRFMGVAPHRRANSDSETGRPGRSRRRVSTMELRRSPLWAAREL